MKTEEVTLEPTLLLKLIYTPPSIKVLFSSHSANSRPTPSKDTPPNTTKT